MKKWFIIPCIICVLIIIFIGISRFNVTNDSVQIMKDDKTVKVETLSKVIYTSFYPIYFLTKEIFGNEAQVKILVPNGGEPHEYEPTIGQMQNIQKADAFIASGLGIESYLYKIQSTYPSLKTIVVSNMMPNIISLNSQQTSNLNADPHIWLSPKMMLKMISILETQLKPILGSENISKNAQALREKMQKLDEEYTSNLALCKQKELVTSHEAFAYLARDYGIIQHAILGMSPEEEPSLKTVANLVKMIKEKHLKALYSEELVSQKFVQTIQKETNINIYTLNALETLTSEQIDAGENYFTIMQKNLDALKKGLECGASS